MQLPHSYTARRQCRYCNRPLEPETIRSWRMNGLLPLGSTARYECGPCQHSFDIRSSFHVVVLTLGLGILSFSIARLQSESILTQLLAYLAMTYMAYAVVENAWNRCKNPVEAEPPQ